MSVRSVRRYRVEQRWLADRWEVLGQPIERNGPWPVVATFRSEPAALSYIRNVISRQRACILSDQAWSETHPFRGRRAAS